ncbi:MAG: hypothetical protein PVG35_09785 [Desulfobacterales bacterium]|jgi:hypothetical protein
MSRTHEALRRAEVNFQKKNFEQKYLRPVEQVRKKPIEKIDLSEKIETSLAGLALSEKQILSQDLKEIRQSLKKIEQCIMEPKTSLNIHANDSETNHSIAALSILIDRKKLLLNRFNDLVTKRKYYIIKKLTKNIADDSIRSSFEKIVNDLYIKDKILQKEYHKLDQMLLTIDAKQQDKKNEVYAEISDKEPIETEKEEPRKTIRTRLRDSLGILTLGILLGCLSLFIAIAPLVGVTISNVLSFACFALIGVVLGLTVAKLTRP